MTNVTNPSILVHGCCAHCTAYTAEHWKNHGHSVTILWYNPNIHPFMEHEQRREAMQTYTNNAGLPLIITDGYEMPTYFRRIAGHEAHRCGHCFRLRMSRTAEVAKERGFSGFSTSLLISPHQDHALIKETGEQVAQETSIPFLYADLRKRFSDSRHITKPMELYRQQYCGCIFSEWERYGNLTIAME